MSVENPDSAKFAEIEAQEQKRQKWRSEEAKKNPGYRAMDDAFARSSHAWEQLEGIVGEGSDDEYEYINPDIIRPFEGRIVAELRLKLKNADEATKVKLTDEALEKIDRVYELYKEEPETFSPEPDVEHLLGNVSHALISFKQDPEGILAEKYLQEANDSATLVDAVIGYYMMGKRDMVRKYEEGAQK